MVDVKQRKFEIGYQLVMKDDDESMFSSEGIAECCGMTEYEFESIQKKHGAGRYIWIEYKGKKQNSNFLIFKSEEDIKKAIEELEPYLIMNRLIK